MKVQIDWDFAGDEDAKAEIATAVRYLLRDATGSGRRDIVRELIEIVHDAADGLLPAQQQSSPEIGATKQAPMSGIIYKAYIIDAFKRDTDRWRATIRRANGKKIRIAFPPSMLDAATTSADALTPEKAIAFAKKTIDGGGLI